MDVESLSELSTIKDLHHHATRIFIKNGVLESEDSSRHLLSKACQLGTTSSAFQSSLNQIATDKMKLIFLEMVKRRINREPVQYIIEEWDFCGLTFICKPPILIPRPETEELVEHVIERLQSMREPIRILDIGSGTGAIGISLLKSLGNRCSHVTSIDINQAAVSLSLENANKILDSNERVKYSCIHNSISSFGNDPSNSYQYDLIVSNPPYIPSIKMHNLQPEVVNFEDKVALDGGNDGLDVVRQILGAGKRLLSSSGTGEIWLEVSEEHPEKIHALCNEKRDGEKNLINGIFADYSSESFIKDLYGNYRFNRLRLR